MCIGYFISRVTAYFFNYSNFIDPHFSKTDTLSLVKIKNTNDKRTSLFVFFIYVCVLKFVVGRLFRWCHKCQWIEYSEHNFFLLLAK